MKCEKGFIFIVRNPKHILPFVYNLLQKCSVLRILLNSML